MMLGFVVPLGTFPVYDLPFIVTVARKPCAETQAAPKRGIRREIDFISVSRKIGGSR